MRTLFVAAIGLALAGCAAGGPSPSPAPSAVLQVVATTTVLADLVRNVAGERAQVHALVPAGTDVHTFDPAPSDALRVSQADLLVMNGLALDEWFADFVRQSGAAGTPLVELAEDLPGVEYIEGGEHGHDEEDEEEPGEHAYNPHLWLNADYAARYVERIATALSAADPDGADGYAANAAAYSDRLADLHSWIADQLAGLPAEARRAATFHDAFAYFAAAYGLEIVGVLVEVPGQEPSAAEVARLIEEIRRTGARLVLAESQFSDSLAQTVARETEAGVVLLYSDALGDAPADSYEGAMRWNVEQIIEALR